jgi:putative phosphoesterase
MKRIGLLSDTHNYLHPQIFDFFEPCDEIWHAGDIGCESVYDRLMAFKPLRAVYGNIDGFPLRSTLPNTLIFQCEAVSIMMTHIGGYPGRYAPGIRQQIKKERPMLFIAGHSHILKVINDPTLNVLHLNPGAAGLQGFHQIITLMRFTIQDDTIKDLEIRELPKQMVNATDQLP